MSSEKRPHVILRPMQLSDVDEVVEIDRLAFPTPWPARTYRYEILNNDRSLMIVLEHKQQASASKNGSSGLGQWFKWLSGDSAHSGNLIGYSGMWHIADEAHVSTIATHPDWRGYKLGELLLWSMVRKAIQNDARMVTLEVRVSNTVAQNLYRKYGFEIMGRRKGYYRDDGEDAYMMGVTVIDNTYRDQLVEFSEELKRIIKVTDKL
jgi:[ribosomal protein S18]-alanine N-acetyltransferase